MKTDSATEDLLRELAPQVLGVLVRRHGQFEECEDAVQEAVLTAAVGWPGLSGPYAKKTWRMRRKGSRSRDQH